MVNYNITGQVTQTVSSLADIKSEFKKIENQLGITILPISVWIADGKTLYKYENQAYIVFAMPSNICHLQSEAKIWFAEIAVSDLDSEKIDKVDNNINGFVISRRPSVEEMKENFGVDSEMKTLNPERNEK